jgi:hypothetical protein
LNFLIAEAYRNKALYEYFKDAPLPKYSKDNELGFFLSTTTGGPLEKKKKKVYRVSEVVARAALKI